MDYSTFKRIVGQDKIDVFQKIRETIGDNQEDFFTLYRLWKYYDERRNTDNNGDNVKQKNVIHQPAEHDVDEADAQLKEMQQDNNVDINCQDKIQEQIREEEKSSDLPLKSQSQEERLIDDACAADTSSCSNSVPGQNLSVTIKQSINMMEYLAWPESPKRKGKRQTERFPYAITSREYQEMFEKKNLAKQRRKRKRRKRQEREEKKAAATTKKESKKSKTKPVCSICSNPKPNISCNSCKNLYHTKCIPKPHQQHEPDLEDDDLFLCHNCSAEDDTDDESFSSADTELEEIKKKNISKENSELLHDMENNGTDIDEYNVDELYQMYLTNKD